MMKVSSKNSNNIHDVLLFDDLGVYLSCKTNV
jgi:hypothetical protein